MKKYNITVNGKKYEVEVEEVGSVSGSIGAKTAPVKVETVYNNVEPAKKQEAVPVVKEVPAVKETPVQKEVAVAPQDGAETISCPMPGTILAVNYSVGDSVKSGDVLFILEAMKMENEIMAPCDGTVAKIGVAKGAVVNTGDLLAIIE